MDSNALRDYLVDEFRKWMYAERDLHRAKARKLTPQEKHLLASYFEPQILEDVRIATTERIANPKFYDELRRSGVPIPMDFAGAIGLMLIDCILIRKELQSDTPGFLHTVFHELVHMVQFEVFGEDRMFELYTEHLLKSSYHGVPFEQQAYSLTARFERGNAPFSVREIIEHEMI